MPVLKLMPASLFLLGMAVAADEAAQRAQLLGMWQSDEPGQDTWVIEAKGEKLRISRSRGNQTIFEVECKPDGKDCEGTASGKKAKSTLYYNGSALVQLETRGSDVTKRMFLAATGTSELQIEVTAIIGDARTESLRLKRIETAAAH
jgi:hypothetical protein